jgi:two-component sensor histidine kinase
LRDAQAGLYLKQSNDAPGILARLGAGQPSKPFLDGLLRHAHESRNGVEIIDGRLAAWRILDLHKGSFASASVPIASLDKWQRRAFELGLLYMFLALAFLGLLLLLYRMRAAGAENEYRALMLSEVNHRVKNVMLILQSMINSRSREAKVADTKTTLDDLSTSVTALADLFATIQDDATTRDIDLSAVITRICDSFERATKRTIAQDVEPVILNDHAKATNISIIVTELITNAVKHSESDIRLGQVGARIRRDPDRWAQIHRARRRQAQELRIWPEDGD